MTGSMKCHAIVVAGLVAANMGCSGDSPSAPRSDQPRVEALSRTTLTGIVGALSPVAPAVRVSDGRTGKPQANVPVRFFLPASGVGLHHHLGLQGGGRERPIAHGRVTSPS